MKSEAEREYERRRDKERERLHMERVERHLDESRREAERNSPQQQQMRAEQNDLLIKGGLALLGLIALLLFAIFLISPGALVSIYAIEKAKYGASIREYWIYSLLTSSILYAASYFATKSIKISAIIYVLICAIASAIAYNTTLNNERTADFALEKLWPFENNANNRTSASPPVEGGSHQNISNNESSTTETPHATASIPPNLAESVAVAPTNAPANAVNEETSASTATSLPEIRASFDCSMANKAIEKMICSDSTLAALDLKLDAAYKSKLSTIEDREAIKSEQIAWIKNVARPCQDKSCLENAYKIRIEELESKN